MDVFEVWSSNLEFFDSGSPLKLFPPSICLCLLTQRWLPNRTEWNVGLVKIKFKKHHQQKAQPKIKIEKKNKKPKFYRFLEKKKEKICFNNMMLYLKMIAPHANSWISNSHYVYHYCLSPLLPCFWKLFSVSQHKVPIYVDLILECFVNMSLLWN